MRSAEKKKILLTQEEEGCNDTMRALWEECKPCLKNTCVKYYSRTCSSGSGLVGRQVGHLSIHFGLTVNATFLKGIYFSVSVLFHRIPMKSLKCYSSMAVVICKPLTITWSGSSSLIPVSHTVSLKSLPLESGANNPCYLDLSLVQLDREGKTTVSQWHFDSRQLPAVTSTFQNMTISAALPCTRWFASCLPPTLNKESNTTNLKVLPGTSACRNVRYC